MSPLNHKLLRDLWRMKGQAFAIGMVIAMGVGMLVMMTGLVTSLNETRTAYYERYRLAEVFAPVTRAPDRLASRLAAIEGVRSVEPRVAGGALIDLPDIDLPVQAQAISLPDLRAPRLNDVFLTDGRMIYSDHTEEILLLQSFANAHGLRPGDRIRATMNGARRSFRIVGLAQSPEFLYTTAPGEMIPDDARFGVIWMSRSALAAAYDMDGAFNEALLSLSRGANEAAVLDAVDRILAPYGGTGAYPLADQISNRFVSEEIGGLEASAAGVPPIFLAVAAFLLYKIVDHAVDASFPMLRKMGQKLERIEDDIFEGKSDEIVRDISNAKQEIITFRRIVRPQRVAFRDLERAMDVVAPEELDVYFDDAVDASERIWDTLENYKEVVEGLEDSNESVLSHRTNDTLRVLTSITVIVLPLTLLASLFGMNVGFPGEGSSDMFWAIMIIMATVLVGMVLAFRSRGWL